MPAMPPSPILWRDDGLPGSALYGDVYFSSEGGLAESRAVFLAGCGLPAAWAGRGGFTVGELGFGAGLNIAALLDLWQATREPGARLRVFTVEAHPMAREDAARALAHWPELGEAARALLQAWPGVARGFHRIDLPAFGAIVDIAILEAGEALAGWDGRADAWFLDGFAPAANPAMWREELLALVGRRSAPGARAATFTVAGAVRRGLAAAGFTVSKQPGFGRKRERLEAVWPGEAGPTPAPGPIAVIGAGIAGASVARAVRALGGEPRVFDPRGPAAAASGNAAALMSPRLDAGDGPPARLSAQAYRRAQALYAAVPEAIIARGARHLATGPKDPDRFARIASGGLFEPEAMEAGECAMAMPGALVLEPAAVVPAWAGTVEPVAIDRLEPIAEGGWRLFDPAGALVMEAAAVVLCGGHASARLAEGLVLRPVRGQASLAEGAGIDQAVSFGGYAIATRDGLLFGATHQRDQAGEEIRPEDDEANLRQLAEGLPELAQSLAGRPLTARAGVRAATPDQLPLAGAVPSQAGLFVLAGLGGRGFCLAPLLGEHLAARLLDWASPLPADLAEAVDPGRFAKRAAKRTSHNPAR
jgi:tRNA 5-methylaminomethyl-2-thiouridine biosynthesis bifunctional protein